MLALKRYRKDGEAVLTDPTGMGDLGFVLASDSSKPRILLEVIYFATDARTAQLIEDPEGHLDYASVEALVDDGWLVD
jgi:hypothetical protein